MGTFSRGSLLNCESLVVASRARDKNYVLLLKMVTVDGRSLY